MYILGDTGFSKRRGTYVWGCFLHHYNEPAVEIAYGEHEQVTTSLEHSERQYYTCPDSSCQKIFAKCFNLERHLAFGNHSYRTNSNSGMM